MKAAKAMGYGSAIVLGHPECYLRFGFVPAAIKWNIKAPFKVSEYAFMAIEFDRVL